MPKRARDAHDGGVGTSNALRDHAPRRSRSIADLFPLQELFLRVLGFLAPEDLARAQGVSRYWQGMALDPQPRRLIPGRYPHPHYPLSHPLTPSSPSTPPRRLRPIARLPSRAFPPPSPTLSAQDSPASSSASTLGGHGLERGAGRAIVLDRGWVRNEGVDWKGMFRLGTNWSNGNVSSQSTISLPPSPSPSAARPAPASSDAPDDTAQHIALFPSFIVTSSPDSPLVYVYPSSLPASGPSPAVGQTALGIVPPPPGWSTPSRPDTVTSICADQSVAVTNTTDDPVPARLAIFYQTGGFVVVSLRLGARLSWTRDVVSPPSGRPRRVGRRAAAPTDDPVVLCALHWPVLVSCTRAFHLAVHLLSPGADRPTCIKTMHSDVAFHPAALTILPDADADAVVATHTAHAAPTTLFKAALTYCTPLYPASWTLAVQELGIDASLGIVVNREALSVGTRPSTAWPRPVRPLVGVRGRAVGVGSDGRWCVLAGDDNQIHVYSLPAPTGTITARPPGRPEHMTHAQTLLAHAGAVSAIALAAGRCVSAGTDGRVLVWELDDSADGEESDDGARIGRAVGHVELRAGGRRPRPLPVPALNGWPGAADADTDDDEWLMAPHPKAISTAARALFLALPPDRLPPASGRSRGPSAPRQGAADRHDHDNHNAPPPIRHIAFDEEKVVGLVHEGGGAAVRVWSFAG
ncbi:hypothetical protein Q5752_000608 [Cryptotrichosporon argae]